LPEFEATGRLFTPESPLHDSAQVMAK
jgi:hypothetical protein